MSVWQSPALHLGIILALGVWRLGVHLREGDHAGGGGGWIVDGVGPIESLVLTASEELVRGTERFRSPERQAREEADLRRIVAEQSLEIHRLRELTRKLEDAVVQSDYAQALKFRTVAARVLHRGADAERRLFFLNVGAHHGLQPQQPIITPQGVVGLVRQVNATTAVAALLTDVSVAIEVRGITSRALGITRGQVGMKAKSVLERQGDWRWRHSSGHAWQEPHADEGPLLRFLEPVDAILEGELLVTVGDGDFIPPGLPVGYARRWPQVPSLSGDAGASGHVLEDRFWLAPVVPLGRVEHVLVVIESAWGKTSDRTSRQSEPAFPLATDDASHLTESIHERHRMGTPENPQLNPENTQLNPENPSLPPRGAHRRPTDAATQPGHAPMPRSSDTPRFSLPRESAP